MIKKIVCPTDFSKAANNATEYAAKIAQAFGAELLLVNLQRVMPLMAAVNLAEGMTAEVRESSHIAAQNLKSLSLETKATFNIPVDYEVDITTSSLSKILSEYASNETMIIMGTDGADNLYQFFFGTNTYNVIKKANCPVLMVPENAIYEGIHKIVFASDDEAKEDFSFAALAEFLKTFDSNLIYLHISKEDNEVNRHKFRTFKEAVNAHWNNAFHIDFEHSFSNDTAERINQYMIKSKADLLAITLHKRTLAYVFQGNIDEYIIESSDNPVLVLPS